MSIEHVRTSFGICFVTIGLVMVVVGTVKHKTLWEGYQTKQVIVNKEVETKPIAEKLPDGQHYTGELRIEQTYEYPDSHLQSGDLQVRDSNNQIWMMKLCRPTVGDVLPDFRKGITVNILYTDGDKCKNFIKAQVTKEDR